MTVSDLLGRLRRAASSRLGWRARLAVSLLFGVVIVGAMVWYVEPGRLVAAVRDADWRLVALGAVVHLCSWGVRAHRYKRILDGLEFRLTHRFLAAVVTITQVGNVLFPARTGDAIRVYLVNAERGVPYTSGFASVTVERILDVLSVIVLGGVTFSLLLWIRIGDVGAADAVPAVVPDDPAVLAVAGGLLFLGALVAVRHRLLRAVVARFPPAERALALLRTYLGEIRTTLSSPARFVEVTGISVGIWLLDSLTASLVMLGFGLAVPVPLLAVTAVAAVSVGAVAKTVPLSPGGIGAYESVFSLVVVLATGVSGDAALTVAIVDHAIKNLVAMLAGLVGLVLFNLSLIETVERSQRVEAE